MVFEGLISTCTIAFRYVWNNTRRSVRGALIGICTVFLVVLFLSFLQNMIQSSPKIFMKLAEGQTSETDLLLSPLVTNTTNTFALNQTEIDLRLRNVPEAVGASARWTMLGTISSTSVANLNSTVIIVIMNSTKEKEIGLGRTWRRRPLGSQECYLSTSAVQAMGIRPRMGDEIRVTFDLSRIIGTGASSANISSLLAQNPLAAALLLNSQAANQTASAADQALNAVLGNTVGNTLSAVVKVVDAVDYPDGKWPAALGNVVVLETSYAQTLLGPLLQLLSGSSTSNFRMEEFAFESHVVYRDRTEAYVQNSDGMNAALIDFSNKVIEGLGSDFPVTVTSPVSVGLSTTAFIRLFLDQIFNMVVIVLVFLGCVLIYSLQLGDVQEKTYEYGMLRALGMRNHTLVVVLITQALFYAVPGIVMAWVVFAVFNVAGATVFAIATVLPIDFSIADIAIGVGIAVGLAMPLASNIFPIRRALSSTLRDSLDVYHSTANDILVRFRSLETLGLSAGQLALAIMLVVIGFVVYYIVPYAFSFNNFPLFLFIFTCILLGMVFGFSLLAQVVQPYFERIVLWCLMWGPDRKLLSLVKKHLHGHRSRNRKTAVMFTTSMAFIIFAGAMFALQANSISDNVRQSLGADIVYQATTLDTKLPELQLATYLDKEMSRGPLGIVRGYSFATFRLRTMPYIYETQFVSLSGFRATDVNVFGLESRFLSVAFTEFLTIPTIDDSLPYTMIGGKPDIIESLYSSAGQGSGAVEVPEGIGSFKSTEQRSTRTSINMSTIYTDYIDVVYSQALTASGSLKISMPFTLMVRSFRDNVAIVQTNYLAKARATLSKAPGFMFSSYQLLSSNSPLFVSMDQYLRILKDVDSFREEPDNEVHTVSDIPKQTLYIKLAAGTTPEARAGLINALNNFIRDSTTLVSDTAGTVEGTKQATDLMNLFFIVVAFISTVLSFFILWLSFTANIRENSWEFGVLRSLGLTAGQVVRSYVYEALALIISSVLLGAVIGVGIAITLTLQFNLFTEQPFQFAFPTVLFVCIVAMSFAVAVIGSYVPATAVTRREIALVLRGM